MRIYFGRRPLSRSLATPPGLANAPFVVLWEVMRVALECDVEIASLDLKYSESWKDQATLWTSLRSCRAFRRQRLPLESDHRAWKLGLAEDLVSGGEAVVLTATLHPTTSKVGPPMRLELHPLKREQSSRLFRKFGSDRFLEVRIPAVDSWHSGQDEIQAMVPWWLTRTSHRFMEREWSGFYVLERSLKVEALVGERRPELKSTFYDRVMLFAEEGQGIFRSRLPQTADSSMTLGHGLREACSRNEMLDWLLNLKMNGAQSYLKLFHRVSIGLTKTVPIMVLERRQISHRVEDLKSPNHEIMNDGAARISSSLMKKVRDTLGLPTIPTAIQGRLGSAKGMWLVDVTTGAREDWIETYPSQRKWKCDESEEAHRTLEVKSWSAELTSASLNTQFLPILEDRARHPRAMRATFVQNMVLDSEAEAGALKQALRNTALFRKWARDNTKPDPHRLLSQSVPFLGGLPDGDEDIMNFLVDGGFEPIKLQFLQDLVFRKMRTKADKMREDLKIKISKSTYAFMLMDFWGILEPNEVHLSFSSKFHDGTDELSDLDGIDVLVARSPAHLPSDIQKVKAVFKPALRHLRDVIIFSSKGEFPLAALLSGGDYDGDKAWVCWDPDIVNNFLNHPLPPQPNLAPYLTKDKTTLNDLRRAHGEEEYINTMIEKSFIFNLRPKLLGPCTSYKEKLCYHRYRISDKTAIKVSWLLSELADQPKQGVMFGQHDWNRFRNDVVGTRQEFTLPAYKTGNLPIKTDEASHIIDFLMYKAKQVVDGALTDLHAFLRSSGASTRDSDVEGYWDHFEGTFGDLSMNGRPRSRWFLTLRDALDSDVTACQREWNGLMGNGLQNYRENVDQVYTSWRAIKPRLPESHDADSVRMVRRFLTEDSPVVPDLGRWELLKASWTFKHHHQRRFVWQMAGRQLQAIKALAVRIDETFPSAERIPVPVVSNIYAALKPDNTYIQRLTSLDGGYDVVHDIDNEAAGLTSLAWGPSQ
ncbi:hypothetical protein N0V93_008940 [Gnomoniopsis smithogilvyi]|uniref:RNA-dependent RNA polymerase n=1 Tax=Gnomoniopsis smithogilvyi TaxID=1191159 RepID=A0A9W8YJW0_9PEZI|nr:hypothetical protein N0V93_008940 [Gnomoniopsis smithogilvyi]